MPTRRIILQYSSLTALSTGLIAAPLSATEANRRNSMMENNAESPPASKACDLKQQA